MRRSSLPVLGSIAVGVMMLVACSPGSYEPDESSPSASAVSYPVPEGCPSAEQFSAMFVERDDWAQSVDAALVDSQLSTPLPPGGCAYAKQETDSATDGSAAKRIVVAFFNLNTPGKVSEADFVQWMQSVGGTPSAESDNNYDLPQSFSGWGGAFGLVADGEYSSYFREGEIPEYTQGAHAAVNLWLAPERVDTLVAQSGGGITAVDPTTTLAQGLSLRFTNNFEASDADGYTVGFTLSGTLEPFSAQVADAVPGEFFAASAATVGGTLSNLTAGRNTEAPGVSVAAIYPMGSAACDGYNGISRAGEDWKNPSYCAVTIGSVNGAQLAPDVTQPLQASSLPVRSGPHQETGDALNQLNAPVSIYAFFGGRRVMVEPTWKSPSGCVVQSSSAGGRAAVTMDGWADVLCGG